MKIHDRELESAFEENITKLAKSLHAFPWADRRAYACWLAQSHYLVCHTTTFLSLVAAKTGPEPSQRHRDVLKHLREETGHELLPLRDIAALGLEVSAFPELIETAVIYQSQYFWLDRGGAIAHVGYSLMLEGLAVREGRRLVDTLQQYHGNDAISFLLVHAEDDVGHFREGLKRLEGASPKELAQTLANLRQSCLLYQAMLDATRAAAAVRQPGPGLRIAA